MARHPIATESQGIEILRLWDAGHAQGEISKRMKISEQTVLKYLKKCGLKRTVQEARIAKQKAYVREVEFMERDMFISRRMDVRELRKEK